MSLGEIANRHMIRIKRVVNAEGSPHKKEFDSFLKGLQENLNPSISEDDAIEMLGQHLITKPVFDALFSDYPFALNNPVSIAMQHMLDVLEDQGLDNERKELERFQTSVKDKISRVTTPAGKQEVIRTLYDKFFLKAVPKLKEKLGIVYTPVEVVDFIIHSADWALQQEFGVGIGDEGVHVLDPFTGTGTFMVRLLQSGLIAPQDLPRKYKQELHANELVLLAYYIAAINIEATYHSLIAADYTPFEGIVLTDTFQLCEEGSGQRKIETVFPQNSERALKQCKTDISVIIGNPPYSAGQKSENDGNKNLKYDTLDAAIRNSYAKYSTATLKNSLYDSYIRAVRWASDRIHEKQGGVVCFVTNGSFIDGISMDGLRKSLVDEFSSIYVFNLRGNKRTQGEEWRREKANVFGEGTRTPVAVTLLVKHPDKTNAGKIHYADIGDYLDQKQKLATIAEHGNMSRMTWKALKPNSDHDWINQRGPAFDAFIPLGDKSTPNAFTLFDTYSIGVLTARDTWCYNFSNAALHHNMERMISFYNEQVNGYSTAKANNPTLAVDDFIDMTPSKISWTREVKNDLRLKKKSGFIKEDVFTSIYRPFTKQFMYFNRQFNNCVYQMPRMFPTPTHENVVMCVNGRGISREFAPLIVDTVPDGNIQPNGQAFPLYTYEKVDTDDQPSLLNSDDGVVIVDGYRRQENIPDAALALFHRTYSDASITKEDIFYYVYGVLHSPEYKSRFEADLKKMLPRIPLTKDASDFWVFSKTGRELAEWHLHYETIEPYPLEEAQSGLVLDEYTFYHVDKMSFPKGQKIGDSPETIHYNSRITLSGIPKEAYAYIVNGKPALAWIMERYAVTKDKDSGIVNDPNLWCQEHEQPRYIVDLIKRIVRVSIESVRLVDQLPALNERVLQTV